MEQTTQYTRTFWLAFLLAFMGDQISKWAILYYFKANTINKVTVIDPLLIFRLGYNYGVNFGLFQSGQFLAQIVLVIIALAVVGIILKWFMHQPFQSPYRVEISVALLVAGALGNAFDRLVHGAVIDFINNSCCGVRNPYIYNVADIAIFAGVVGLVLFSKPAKHKSS